MAITRLKRKGRRNKQTASIRRASIKQLTAKPVIKNVDIEEIKEGFAKAAKEAKPEKETKAKVEAPKAEAVTEKKAVKKPAAKKVAPKAEASTEKKTTKKPAAKKAAPKKKEEKEA